MKIRNRAAVAVSLAVVAAGGIGVVLAETSTSAAATPTASVIKIGMVAPIDSPIFSNPDAVASVRAAILALNATGGLGGHPVKLDYCNDQVNPNQTLICARQMISDHVAFVAGGAVIFGGTSLTPALAKAGIPQVGLNADSPTEYNSPNAYLLAGGSYFEFQMLAAYAGRHKIPTGVLVTDNPASTATVPALTGEYTHAGGGPITGTVLVSPTQADFAPLVASAQASGTKALLTIVGTSQQVQFAQAAQSAGAKFTYLTLANFTPSEISQAGLPSDINDSVITATPFPSFASSLPIIKTYLSQLAAEKRTGDVNATNAIPVVDFQGWLGVQAVAAVVKQDNLRTITAATLTKALNSAKNINLGGAIPPWTPSKKGPAGFSRVSNQANYLFGYRNGNLYAITKTAVTPAQAAAGDFK